MRAYSTFKRPSTLDNAGPFLEASSMRFQGREHYTPNLAQEINLSRNRRQLIADKGSFDGGTSSVQVKVLNSTIRCEAMEAGGRLCRVGRDEANTGVVISPTITFRAALTERCFRYKRLIRQVAGLNKPVLVESYPRGALPNNLGRFISSQLDRILSLNKATLASSGVMKKAPCPVGVCRIDWAAQLTQTKQGGCLYEQPCSQRNCNEDQIYICLVRPLDRILLGQETANTVFLALALLWSCIRLLWQKPGIGILKSSKCNQNQAMSTPDNLVGGVERLDHTNRFVGSMTAQ